jgi:hypothetical protein
MDMLFMFEKDMLTALSKSPCRKNFVFIAMNDGIFQ